MSTFEYKGLTVVVETAQEYTWMPMHYIVAINGRYQLKSTVKASNRRLLSFRSQKQAENAAKRLIDSTEYE